MKIFPLEVTLVKTYNMDNLLFMFQFQSAHLEGKKNLVLEKLSMFQFENVHHNSICSITTHDETLKVNAEKNLHKFMRMSFWLLYMLSLSTSKHYMQRDDFIVNDYQS